MSIDPCNNISVQIRQAQKEINESKAEHANNIALALVRELNDAFLEHERDIDNLAIIIERLL